ncbi:MAG: hypothetical protein IKM97_05385 [Clostridia bacterium]|nr:hypothetical protein [Clostridia bacterium]
MRIGVDIGGSHIGIGLIEGSKIIDSKDKILAKSDIFNIEQNIIDEVTNIINDLCIKNKIDIKEIELIGIASPRYNFRWSNCKSRKFRNKKI